MKKSLAALLITALALTFTACNEPSDSDTTDSIPEQTPPITYEVKYIGANGEKISPYEEMMFRTDIVIFEDGSYSQLDADGYLAFYSVPNYLPLCSEKLPTVALDESSELVITARDGVAFEQIEKVDVYGEDGEAYRLLASDMTLAEIARRGRSEWKEQVLYLYFDVGFHDTEAAYEKMVRNGYFAKTKFPLDIT